MARITASPQQPTVAAEFVLLDREYTCGDLLLDLYGELDADGYKVCDVTLTGTKVSLFDLVPSAMLRQMSDRCNDVLPDWFEIKRAEAIAAARATREVVAVPA